MGSTYLIGTAPDQIPTNADLGELAFQNKDGVSFTDGRGGLSHLDLTAINQQLNVSALDVFVYDTSKDSDGGLWRNRCQHTSWYNEPLNTTTRGARREFPSVAVFVVEQTKVTIYDGDDATLPMWMVFNTYNLGYGQGGGLLSNGAAGYCNQNWTPNAVCALNGQFWLSTYGYYNGSPASAVSFANFLTDGGGSIGGAARSKFLGNIAQRNTLFYSATTLPYYTGGYLPGASTNDVAMAVLEGAPIDQATGLPIPTIVYATVGGVCFIKHDGNIVNLVETSGPNAVYKITFRPDSKVMFYTSGTADPLMWPQAVACYVPASNISITYWYNGSEASLPGYEFYGGGWDSPAAYGVPLNVPNGGDLKDVANNYLSNTKGLFKILPDIGKRSATAVTQITTTYNTGYQVGNIKGAWLSDTITEQFGGVNLIVNEGGNSTIGWYQPAGNTLISTGGYLKCTSSTGDAAYFGQGFNVIEGKTYKITTTTYGDGTSKPARTFIGTNVGSGDIVTGPSGYINGTTTFYYTATATRMVYLWFYGNVGGNGTYILVDFASVTQVDSDRSIRGTGLDAVGTITKTPVATGADLVAYSGFSTSNYLEQSYNSLLDFGTGDYCIMAWLKPDAASGYWWERCHPGSTSAYTESYYNNGYIKFHINGGTDAYQSITTGIWSHVACIRRSGVLSVYVNGIKGVDSTANGGANLDNSNAILRVGIRAYNVATPFTNGSIALFRASATAPNPEQLLKIYQEEKPLFQDGAKATLYGTSNVVNALAYDSDTTLLHAGTSSGRSVFKGITRVDYTTTAVSAAISAANGLVAEN